MTIRARKFVERNVWGGGNRKGKGGKSESFYGYFHAQNVNEWELSDC